ncbi:MAG TPA: ribosomal-processing cysteine protease Prp [Firmicutes bacterium]|jgi:uncharacterized protein YsxB (DUF464 family)|nr:ribosomal-processing cysteine protease Prp [Bacillota bacterium]
MVKIKVVRGSDNRPLSVEVKGHALFAPSGSDIVCAAVSILTQTVLFALEDLLGLKPPAMIKNGYLLMSSPAEIDKEKEEKCFLLLETMLLGLKETARSYPRHIVYTEEKKVS